MRLCTHTEEVAEAEVLSADDWFSPSSIPSWGIFGELGAEESGVAISSMSEYVLGPFLMLNALLKELLSYGERGREILLKPTFSGSLREGKEEHYVGSDNLLHAKY